MDTEARDDAVEDRAVVERARLLALGVGLRVVLGTVGQAHEVRDRLGRVVAVQLDRDVALVGVDGCLLRCDAHCLPPATAPPAASARRWSVSECCATIDT